MFDIDININATTAYTADAVTYYSTTAAAGTRGYDCDGCRRNHTIKAGAGAGEREGERVVWVGDVVRRGTHYETTLPK